MVISFSHSLLSIFVVWSLYSFSRFIRHWTRLIQQFRFNIYRYKNPCVIFEQNESKVFGVLNSISTRYNVDKHFCPLSNVITHKKNVFVEKMLWLIENNVWRILLMRNSLNVYLDGCYFTKASWNSIYWW